MTPSATSSPVVLLSGAVDSTKSALPTVAKASGDASGEGFQLLLAQAAEGLLSISGLAPVSADTSAGSADNAASTEQTASADGNALPLLSNLLPLAPAAVDAQGNPAGGDAEQKDKTSADKKPTDKKSEDNPLVGVMLLNTQPLPPLPTAPTAPISAAVAAAAAPVSAPTAAVVLGSRSTPVSTSTSSSTISAETEVAAQSPGNASATSAVTKTAAATATNDDGSVAVLNGIDLTIPMLKKPAAADGAAKAEIPVAAAGASAPADKSIAAQLGIGKDNAAQQPAADADFAAVLKQLDTAPAAISSNPTVDSSRAVQPTTPQYVAANAAPATATVSMPVGADGWCDAVTDKVMWFSANKITSAEIHLNPPDLGPIQVRISTQQDQVSVYFTSQHAAVRDALDQALPRLRDMMGGQGMQLLDAGVGGQGATPQQQYSGNPDGRPRSAANDFFRGVADSEEPIAVTSIATTKLSRSGIDAYA